MFTKKIMTPQTQEYIEASIKASQDEFDDRVSKLSPENKAKMLVYEKAFNDLKESGLSFHIFYHIPGTDFSGSSRYTEPDYDGDRPTK